MTPAEVPQELIDILDRAAGRAHFRYGRVVTALAEILTAYDQMRHAAVPRTCTSCGAGLDPPHDCPGPRVVIRKFGRST